MWRRRCLAVAHGKDSSARWPHDVSKGTALRRSTVAFHAERGWLSLRERFLSLRVREGYEAIVDAGWNAIADDARRVRPACVCHYIQPQIRKLIGQGRRHRRLLAA